MKASRVICVCVLTAASVTTGRGAAEPSGARPSVMKAPTTAAPHLIRDHDDVRLMVDGRPFLILGGELGNSSASTLASAKPALAKAAAMNLNTVLVPVSWELIEPTEGAFTFALVGDLVAEARRLKLHVVLLWFGSWKNGMSSYVPAWIKSDQKRFPRAEDKGGHGVESLSAFADANRDADTRAFAALMRYVHKIDGDEREHTVIMVQVENEIAMIGDAADRSAAAVAAFRAAPPAALLAYLTAHRAALAPWLLEAWGKRKFATAGGWEDVFGSGRETEQLFMAWHYARYTDAVARAGKAEYPLPMFVNAALNRPGLAPGQYPSGGPLARLSDAWKPGAPSIDFLAPDIYLPNFAAWCDDFARADNPLFIPEARDDREAPANATFAVGVGALGFSPFSIESSTPEVASALTARYALLGQLAPTIHAARARGKAWIAGVLLTKEQPSRTITVGDHILSVRHDYTWEWASPARNQPDWPHAGGLIVALASDEYIVAGEGVIVTFAPKASAVSAIAAIAASTATSTEHPIAGIERADEGHYVNGTFTVTRRLNGDETHQGRHVRLPMGAPGVQRVKLYRYR